MLIIDRHKSRRWVKFLAMSVYQAQQLTNLKYNQYCPKEVTDVIICMSCPASAEAVIIHGFVIVPFKLHMLNDHCSVALNAGNM